MNDSMEWLAGIVEGEGCFTMTTAYGRIQPRFCLVMTDEDIVRRAYEVVGVGNVTFGERQGDNRKDVWRWIVCGYKAIALGLSLYPYLGQRRRARIAEITKAWMNQPARRKHNSEKTHCPYGHPYDEANTYWYTRGHRQQRMCRECRNQESKRRRAKLKAVAA